jgi:hypothetical protein
MRFVVIGLLAMAGCKSAPLTFQCQDDGQCGAGATCVSGACAVADSSCPSGYRLDPSAGGAGGQCVPIVDMAASGGDDAGVDMASPDMAATLDLTTPPDLAITCAQQGQPCTAGLGACARTGTVMCSTGGVASCSATPGAPDTTGTWHQSAATNGSWDWDCDGSVEYQYPSGDTTPPPIDEPAIHDCGAVAIQAVCTATHWYYVYEHSYGLPSCGHPVEDMICNWSGNYCNSVTTEETPQGCR